MRRLNLSSNSRSDLEDFNCFGYAVDKDHFLYVPHVLKKLPSGMPYVSYDDETCIKYIESYGYELLPDDYNLVRGEEYIFFRYDPEPFDRDFHFIYRDVDGNYSEKRGRLTIQLTTEEFVFSPVWNYGSFGNSYSSKMLMFKKL